MNLNLDETPKFSKPPVVETVLGVQFAPLPEMRLSHYGLFWNEIRAQGFIHSEEYPALEHVVEKDKDQGRTLVFTIPLGNTLPSLPRVWLKTDDTDQGQSLVQVQNDRFLANWKRHTLNDIAYPSYKHNRSEFEVLYEKFSTFASKEKLGEILPDQCEVVYVNQIPIESESSDPMTMFTSCFPMLNSNAGLPFKDRTTDAAGFNLSFWIPEMRGRLYIQAQTVTLIQNRTRAIDLRLTARGAPESTDPKAVMKCLDLCHYFAVTSFANITSDKMHTKWGRTK